jgi:predicted MFS family arabinose efflux permease
LREQEPIAVPPRPLSYRELLRLPHVGSLLSATMLSRLAGRMFILTLVLHALDRTHSSTFAGWLSFAALAPGLLTSPLSGAILDRIGAAQAIVIDMAVSATLVLGLAVAGAAGDDTPALLLGLVGVFSLTSPLSAAGIRTVLPRLVPTDVLDRANALDTLIHGLVDVTGPAMAGLLVATVGAPATLLLIACLYAAAALVLRGLRSPAPDDRVHRALLGQAVEGLAIVSRTPTLRGLVASYALYEVSWGILLIAVPVVVGRHVDTGPARDTITGALWAGLGAAGIVGALLAGQLRAMGRERQSIALGTLVTALALYPIGAVGGVAGLAVALGLIGLMAGPVDVAVLTLRQRRTPPDQLGRVLAVSMSLNVAGMPVGSALGGWLLSWAPGAVMPTAALAAVLSSAACWWLIPARDR